MTSIKRVYWISTADSKEGSPLFNALEKLRIIVLCTSLDLIVRFSLLYNNGQMLSIKNSGNRYLRRLCHLFRVISNPHNVNGLPLQ